MFQPEDLLSKQIISAALEVHTNLGPGLLESVYEEALIYELRKKSLKVVQQKEVPVIYKDVVLNKTFRTDLIVEELVLVECKAVAEFNNLFLAQCLTYLKLTDLKLGLVINFGKGILKNGVHRVVNNL